MDKAQGSRRLPEHSHQAQKPPAQGGNLSKWYLENRAEGRGRKRCGQKEKQSLRKDEDDAIPSASYASTAQRRKDKKKDLDVVQAQEEALAALRGIKRPLIRYIEESHGTHVKGIDGAASKIANKKAKHSMQLEATNAPT